MAGNPFNIDALNAINLGNDEIARVIIGSVSGGSSVNPLGLWDDEIPPPGVISVLSNEYVAGHLGEPNEYGYQNYYLPNFGKLQFEGVVDGDGNPIDFWVYGFSENGLLLSDHENINSPTTGGDFTSPSGPPNIFVFGSYGVSSDAPGVGDADDVIIGLNATTFEKDPSIFNIPEEPVVCFAEATSLDTPDGCVAVEELHIGDMVLTASNEIRTIKWIGELLARPARHPRPNEVNPVRICAGAFGSGLPERDLRLSPGHAVYVDGVLVPVSHLINGATIVQEAVESVRYFHIELDSHDVILAEGLPCETYLDDGNRRSFVNNGESIELHGRLDPKSWDDACAPMVMDGPQLTTIQQRLFARAEELGWMRSEVADLVIEADGVTILPEQEGSFRFQVPAAERVVLRSASGVLAHVMPGMADRRCLGVAISALRTDGEAVALDADLFGAGFHAAESHGNTAWRWSDGAGVIELAGRGACTIDIELAMVAPTWRREAATLRVAA
ncbi:MULTISPECIES: Hint domain-containing protein [Sphingomonadales]|jgi:hypothetical protein|uniref:Hint domain-containing protein n=2 Tax=Sphingomonadaceae TaxID=41297 RepID=A0A397PC38_9SPHN|nr:MULTISPECIES: Hint domain-containing protein [Sphingomonadaceae]EKU73387.1 hypothetical protein HMPREF9718_03856 [Sphingobium yanoikuyae ATCC 51230]RIA45983.1 Hint domain-containing protein [Hephaestia caeni]WQE08172.1 Hint domain-containing protein [Sphingobium yanoikuyae]